MRQHFSRVKGVALVVVQRRIAGRRRRNLRRSGPIRSLARTFLAEKFESSGRFPYFRRLSKLCVSIFLGSRALPLSRSGGESLVAGGEISARSGPIRSLARTFLVEKFESSGRFPYFRRLSKLCVSILLKSRALPLSRSGGGLPKHHGAPAETFFRFFCFSLLFFSAS